MSKIWKQSSKTPKTTWMKRQNGAKTRLHSLDRHRNRFVLVPKLQVRAVLLVRHSSALRPQIRDARQLAIPSGPDALLRTRSLPSTQPALPQHALSEMPLQLQSVLTSKKSSQLHGSILAFFVLGTIAESSLLRFLDRRWVAPRCYRHPTQQAKSAASHPSQQRGVSEPAVHP